MREAAQAGWRRLEHGWDAAFGSAHNPLRNLGALGFMLFAFTLGRLSRDGFARDEILHVAQSQYHDIGVAKALGYTVCWIERRKGMQGAGGTIAVERQTEPHYHFGTLAELADLAETGQLLIRR